MRPTPLMKSTAWPAAKTADALSRASTFHARIQRARRMQFVSGDGHVRGRNSRPVIIAEPLSRRKEGGAILHESLTTNGSPAAETPVEAVVAPAEGALVRPRWPRERLRSRGAAGLSDGELIALVLGSGTAGRSALRIGRRL